MPHVNAGDTAWLLASAAFVMFMTPGLAFFYGGLVRAKNVVGTVMQSFIALAVVTITWALIGYSLAFGPDKGGIIGGLDFFALNHVGGVPNAFAPTVPATTFMAFQMMFAIITPALIAGAFAERMKFSGYLMFIALWSIVVYAPLAHWEWGGGFLGADGVGALDFAGGAVVHANAGAAALATAIYLGRRRGHGVDDMSPHNVPFVILGAGILWFGWFGFNAGSALSSGALASSALVNRSSARPPRRSRGSSRNRRVAGRPPRLGPPRGRLLAPRDPKDPGDRALCVGISAIGLIAGLVCFQALRLKDRFGYDDSLDVVGVHMVGGVVGVLLTGAFASLAINAAGAAASLAQVGKQAVLVGVTLVFSFVATIVLLKITDVTVGLRLSDEHEEMGLDASQHGELAYRMGDAVR
jgi:Amt family ammonium transporter